jgi:hypothetical protein
MAVLFKVRNANATLVQVTAGSTNLKSVTVVNAQAATVFVQFFNALTANVTLGTTTPDYEIQVAANSTFTTSLPSEGLIFPTALCVGSTTTEGGLTGSANGVMLFIGT